MLKSKRKQLIYGIILFMLCVTLLIYDLTSNSTGFFNKLSIFFAFTSVISSLIVIYISLKRNK